MARVHPRLLWMPLLIALMVGSLLAPAQATPAQQMPAPRAPDWMLGVVDFGTWQPPTAAPGSTFRHGWLDARVANLRFLKRVFVEVYAPYANGAAIRTVHHARHVGYLPSGHERWGSDTIELYPDGGPQGSALAGPVLARFRLQHEHQGAETMFVSDWTPIFGSGTPLPPAADDPWDPSLDSPVAPAPSTAPAPAAPRVFFAPFDDPGQAMLAEIDAIIARQLAAPSERHTLHAAMFNLNDVELLDRVIAAHQAGVEVRLVMDARKLRPWYHWHSGDDRLLAAGVPLIGVRRDGTGAMHDKLVLLDGRRLATGSFNWETGARFHNHENLLLLEDRELVAAYARRFVTVAGGPQLARAHAADPLAPASVSFAPDEEPHRIVGRLIDEAQTSVHVAMFTAKDVAWWEHGQQTSLLRKLIAAHQRGVDVIALIDHGIHEASEYYGTITPDDPIDEWLEDQGVHVVRADNQFARYASMHHKFVVVDGEVVVTGAFNWYHDAAFKNDEDQLVLRDPALAARYTGELVDLLHRYDPAFDAAAWPQVDVTFEVSHGGTQWGDQVGIAGEIAATGAWDPAQALTLDGSAWPTWSATLRLPMGLRVRHKLVVRHRDGAVSWEPRGDRSFVVPCDAGAVRVPLAYGR